MIGAVAAGDCIHSLCKKLFGKHILWNSGKWKPINRGKIGEQKITSAPGRARPQRKRIIGVAGWSVETSILKMMKCNEMILCIANFEWILFPFDNTCLHLRRVDWQFGNLAILDSSRNI